MKNKNILAQNWKRLFLALIVLFITLYVIIHLLINDYYLLNPYSTLWIVTLFVSITLIFIYWSDEILHNFKQKVGMRIVSFVLLGFSLNGLYDWTDLPYLFLYQDIIFDISFKMIFIALILLSLTFIFDLSKRSSRGSISNISEFVIQNNIWIVIFFTLMISYFTFGRDRLKSVYPIYFHFDWMFISLVSMVMSVGFFSYVNKSMIVSDELFPSDFHTDLGELGHDERWIKLQRDFVKEGKKEKLLQNLSDLLNKNSKLIKEEKVEEILRPLRGYEDGKVPFYMFGPWQDKIEQKNKINRKLVLEKVIDRIDRNIEAYLK